MLGVPPWVHVAAGDDGALGGNGDEGTLATVRAFTCAALAHTARSAIAGIPQLLVALLALEAAGEGGTASGVVGDPTGSLHALFPPRVLEEWGADLAPGATLLLRAVSLVTLDGVKYLTVTPSCVVSVSVVPAATPPPAAAPPPVAPYLFK